MATLSAVDSFWATFTEMRKLLYRHITLLFIITIPVTYQIICVEFLIEEWEHKNYLTNGTASIRSDNLSQQLSSRSVSSQPETVKYENQDSVLIAVHYGSMLIGVISLGMIADRCGRLRVLFPTLGVMFLAAFSCSFFTKIVPMYTLLRFIVGFASGGAMLCIFTLTAEYVDPLVRTYVVAIIWLAASLANISFPGFAYAIDNKEVLLAAISLPLLLAAFMWRIVPESPRWTLLNSNRGPREESRMLLRRFVSEERQAERKFTSCWSLWGRFGASPPTDRKDSEPEWRWWRCLKKKEFRRIFGTLSFAWFALGLLFCGLNTSSIQLLHNFYSNYAVRELINIPAIFIHCLLVNWAGRRLTAALCMTCGGLLCLLLLMSSSSFLSVSGQSAVEIVVQLIGRGFVATSVITLCLYTLELFPTILRCSAVGLVSAVAFFGVAVAPLLMKLESTHPIVPLGIMGVFSILAGILSRGLLPETKGKMTAETLDDSCDPGLHFDTSGSPKVHRRLQNAAEMEECGLLSPDGGSSEELFAHSEENSLDTSSLENCLGTSWEVSFDRASHSSKWEWLSYEDARQSKTSAMFDSMSVEQSLQEESKILADEDIKMLSKRLPSSTWVLVYSTYLHGISLSTLYYRMRDFETPVLVVIKDSKGYVFGVFAPVSLRVDPSFYGVGRSFFFTCKPDFKVFPCSGKNEYYMTGEVDSLAFGCTGGTFGLWLDRELYHGRSTACATYDSDVLSGTEDFICHGLEAWTFE